MAAGHSSARSLSTPDPYPHDRGLEKEEPSTTAHPRVHDVGKPRSESEGETYVPEVNSTQTCLFPNSDGDDSALPSTSVKCTDIQNAIEANAIFTVTPLFQEMGLSCEIVENLRSWAEDMWPLGDWNRYIQGECTGIYILKARIGAQESDELGGIQVEDIALQGPAMAAVRITVQPEAHLP